MEHPNCVLTTRSHANSVFYSNCQVVGTQLLEHTEYSDAAHVIRNFNGICYRSEADPCIFFSFNIQYIKQLYYNIFFKTVRKDTEVLIKV